MQNKLTYRCIIIKLNLVDLTLDYMIFSLWNSHSYSRSDLWIGDGSVLQQSSDIFTFQFVVPLRLKQCMLMGLWKYFVCYGCFHAIFAVAHFLLARHSSLSEQ